ncbi:hypothetical protein ACFVGY_13320 [Streptomyces sp. NPDC127106]|uniref:hypothetical protein n=1 Tax=Streptomyces sp. NPDC127106 TaxID=3345360 RepID=UPI0036305185
MPKEAQELAQQLVQQQRYSAAIHEIARATGYDRRDSRCVVLALTYAVKVPLPRTSPTRRAGRR